MENTKETDATNRPVVASNRVDAAVAIILLAIGVVIVYESRRLGFKWAADGPEAGYFPFFIGLILCLSSAAVLFQSLLGKHKNRETFVDRQQLKQVMAVLIPAGFFVLAIQLIGTYVASALYIALFMIILGKYSRAKSIIVAILVSAAFFLMFEVWFKVPLFKGEFDPLGFLGY